MRRIQIAVRSIHIMAIIVFVLITASFTSRPGYACKCSTPPPDVAFSRSDIVFEGRVKSVWPVLVPSLYVETAFIQQTYKFQVFRIWKGEIKGDSVVIITQGSNCDFHFKPGLTYLVFTGYDHFFPERMTATICSRTTESRNAIEDLAFLGPGKRISPSSYPFIPESKFLKLCRHAWVYFLTGLMLVLGLRFHDFAMSPGNPLLLFFLLHLIMISLLWLFRKKYSTKKFPVVFLVSTGVFFISLMGLFLSKQSPLIGYCTNLVLLLLISIYFLIKIRIRLTLFFLFFSICFILFGIFNLANIFYSDEYVRSWFGFLF